MKLPSLARPLAGVASLALLSLAPSTAHSADDWEATMGDLGRTTTRIGLHLGAFYGATSGSEVRRVEPAAGLEVGASYRVLGSFSLYGSYALSSADVKGQVTELIDQKVRPDGRSGNVDGTIDLSRFRAGIRVDALREKGWKYQPYLVLAASITNSTVELKTVDGAPPRPSRNPEGILIDPSSFADSQIGAMGRLGVEYPVANHVGANLAFTYEGIELPPGTHSVISAYGGLTLRF